MVEYLPRAIDSKIRDNLDAFGAVLLVGPKWCGKTTTAEFFAKSVLDLQDTETLSVCRTLADRKISLLLQGESPRLIDEWQTIPQIWDAVKHEVDRRNGEAGLFILTGSTSVDPWLTLHSGAGRIARLKMGTMSLNEQRLSTGEVSVGALFDGAKEVAGQAKMQYEDYARATVRGGWPATVGKTDKQAHTLIEGYCNSLTQTDISAVDGKKRNQVKAAQVMRALSKRVSAPAVIMSKKEEGSEVLKDSAEIGDLSDCSENLDAGVTRNTMSDYIEALEKLYVIDDLPAWCPNLRSKTAIRTTPTRHLVDPALAAYFLNASAEDLMFDPRTFGLLFESMVIRDLRAYAQVLDGAVYHYRDGDGLEADAVMHLQNGRWGAFEVKMGISEVDKAAENLKKLRGKVDEVREHPPSFLAVITSSSYAYTRDDGVHVIPLGCLKE